MTNGFEKSPQELPPITDIEKEAFRKKILDLVRHPHVFTLPQHIHPDDEIDHLWGTTYQKGNIIINLTIPVPGVINYTNEKYEAEVQTPIFTSPDREHVKYQTLALINGQLNYKEKTKEFDAEGEEVKEPRTETSMDSYDRERGLQELRRWMASPPENYRKEYEEVMRVLNTLKPEDELID